MQQGIKRRGGRAQWTGRGMGEVTHSETVVHTAQGSDWAKFPPSDFHFLREVGSQVPGERERLREDGSGQSGHRRRVEAGDSMLGEGGR